MSSKSWRRSGSPESVPGDDHYEAKVAVLGEYINHHVEEEEGEMFVKARKSDVDTAALGMEIGEREDQLKSELGVEYDAPDASPTSRSGSGSRRTAAAGRK